MKKIKKLTTNLFIAILILFLTLFAFSCAKNKKEFKPWGDNSFVKHYSIIEAKEKLNSAKLINEIDYSAKTSNTMYQMLVYAFADGNNDGIGDFFGAAEKLSYLKELGIDQIWLSPIHPSSSYHGYDVIDYTDVAPELGGMKAFDIFLENAHKLNIKIYLDMVFNHTSYSHPWFQKALRDPSSKYRKYYEFEDNGLHYGDAHVLPKNLAEKFVNLQKPVKISRINGKDIPYVSKFWAGMPDLNLDNPNVINELSNIQKFWVKKGVDGFRYDAFQEYFSSPGETQNNYNLKKIFVEFRNRIIQGAREANRSSKFDPFLLGEWWDSIYKSRNVYYDPKNRTLDSAYDSKHWKNNAHVTMQYIDMYNITNTYKSGNFNEQWTPFLDNHDENRWVNSYLSQIRQINPSLSKNNIDQKTINAMSAALFSLLTRPANPIIFQGDELTYHGFKNPDDASLREPIKWNSSKYLVNFYEKRSGETQKIQLVISSDRPSAEEQINNPQQAAYIVKKINEWRTKNSFIGKTDPQTIENYEKYAKINLNKPGNIFIRKNASGTKKFLVAFTLEQKIEIKLLNKFKKIVIKGHGIQIQDNKITIPANSFLIVQIV